MLPQRDQLAKPRIEILGKFDRQQLFCAGSVSKMLTTFVVLSYLETKFPNDELEKILDDEAFLDKICSDKPVHGFLKLLQRKIGSSFTLRDLCTFHTGLPYTFNPTKAELDSVVSGERFTHQSVMDEAAFISLCENNISMIYRNRQKFHYSEISIMALGYLIENAYGVKIEDLYQHFLVNKFKLSQSRLSRVKPEDAYFNPNMSQTYDYACVALQNHGYFSYGNGFYTTLDDLEVLLGKINSDHVFQLMVDVKNARRAESTVMNGLTVELRQVGDDLVYGYEGMSFSGCTTMAFSTMQKTWCVTFGENAEEDYHAVCSRLGYPNAQWKETPESANIFYTNFTHNYPALSEAVIPLEYQGIYRRVKLNDGQELEYVSVLGNNFLTIRDPDEVTYDLVQVNDEYHIKGDDNVVDSRVGLYTANGSNRFLFYIGNLYKRIEVDTKSEPSHGSRMSH
jgi:CubicO group peptidase (beta-lactamase class C family)